MFFYTCKSFYGISFHPIIQERVCFEIFMMTSSNGNISALLVICAGNSPVPGEFPAHRPVTRSFDVFFDLCPNKRLSKQWWSWWFEAPSSPLLRHCNVHRARQWYCRALYKIAIRLDNWNGHYRMRSREIWVYDEFWADIPYCTLRHADASSAELGRNGIIKKIEPYVLFQIWQLPHSGHIWV